VNAKNGTPSIGLLQVIRPTFDANKDARFPGGQTDPDANIAAALNYATTRYGSVEKIWPTTQGYALGGWITGIGGPRADANLIGASRGEFMVNADSAARNATALEAINAGAVATALPALPAGFGAAPAQAPQAAGSTTNFFGTQVADYHGLVEVAERKQHLAGVGPMASLP
jgi:hypothetical protein